MKRIARNVLVLVVSAVALSALTFAQDATYHLNVSVPFDFYAAHQQLPAGTYQFAVNYETHAVTLRNRETGRSFTLLAVPSDGESFAQAMVEFDVIGDTHWLADLKTANAGVKFSSREPSVTAARSSGKVAIVATLR